MNTVKKYINENKMKKQGIINVVKFLFIKIKNIFY